ncbi:site-specific DNA-methyltransferase [Epilithonimonas tenax]|uniref:site-specific DNA-methyltransferase n=1 Tax=Epilithonimonas tenax TaxID=191577 RepID=UPI000423CB84|nr:site-specific DNA-methyltransferase [Epilithonimonas tenax]
MNQKEQLMHSGFQILETENQDNKLLDFLKENYPSIIRDNEINVNELKALSGLPVDEKVNGYGLNFIGRNVARAKYATKTTKEVKVNYNQSKNFDTTQNLVLKGDNLESLKILKSHYSGAIKCIYIDPPYNTKNDEFVYPDKFDKEEAEVLGLANLSENDMERMEFSFKTKQSHNGWLSFMYPRLLLARDLLAKDGVIFISIDDNEQANLKLLCDEIFGEENFVAILPTIMNLKGNNDEFAFAGTHEFTVVYSKNKDKSKFSEFRINEDEIEEWKTDELGYYKKGANLKATGTNAPRNKRPNLYFPIYLTSDNDCFTYRTDENDLEVFPITNNEEMSWRWSKNKFINEKHNIIVINDGNSFSIYKKQRPNLGDIPSKKPKTIFYKPEYSSGNGTQQIKDLFGDKLFTNPKPLNLIKDFFEISTNSNDIVLDFFAGSGTTGQAVMQLNAEDGGNRKFILCQIDEPIKKDKPANQFCIDHNLPPVISSVTIERLNRAGEKIKTELETENTKTGMFDENKKQIPDIGYKVFDTTEAPELELKEGGQIIFPSLEEDALSRIYNMIFSVGIDSPVSRLECVVENCIYKIGNNYYITNSADAKNEDITNAIKNGKVFVDGWSAGINTTLQHYKEDVKIVF